MEQLLLEFNVKYTFGQLFYYPVNDAAKEVFKVFTNRRNRKAFTYDQVMCLKRCGAKMKINKPEDKKQEALEK